MDSHGELGGETMRVPAHRTELGQSFVEFAISLVFILMLLAVVLDLGHAFYTVIVLRDAAQEAAAYGAICPFATSDSNSRNDVRIKSRLIQSAPVPLKIHEDDISVKFAAAGAGADTDPDDDNIPVMGGSVIISVELEHEIAAPLVGAVIGASSYPLRVTVADTVLRSKWLGQCD